MKRNKWLAVCLAGCLLLALSACANPKDAAQAEALTRPMCKPRYNMIIS